MRTRRRQQHQRGRRNDGNANIGLIGTEVSVVQKHDQQTGLLTTGIVGEILTNSSFHPRGIKVRLTDGTVGRISSSSSASTQQQNAAAIQNDDTGRRPKASLADFMGPATTTTNAQIPQPPPAELEDWACQVCTFVNSGFLHECEACQTVRAAPDNK